MSRGVAYETSFFGCFNQTSRYRHIPAAAKAVIFHNDVTACAICLSQTTSADSAVPVDISPSTALQLSAYKEIGRDLTQGFALGRMYLYEHLKSTHTLATAPQTNTACLDCSIVWDVDLDCRTVQYIQYTAAKTQHPKPNLCFVHVTLQQYHHKHVMPLLAFKVYLLVKMIGKWVADI